MTTKQNNIRGNSHFSLVNGKADLVIYGNIYTADERDSIVEAIAIKDGKFIYVGSKENVKDYIDEKTIIETYDSSQLITPGLVDGHTHVGQISIGYASNLGQISPNASKEKCINEIASYVNSHPDYDFYSVTGWEQESFVLEKFNYPTSDMLEGITDKPILASSSDYHCYWVNKALLKLAGITKETPSPDGGEVVRDEKGDAIGVFVDSAMSLIDSARPGKSKEEYQRGISLADEECLNEGYVYRLQPTDNDTYKPMNHPIIDAFEELDNKGKRTAYSQSSIIVHNTDDVLMQVDELIRLRDSTKGGSFEVTTLKIGIDGVFENASACLSKPYDFNPNDKGMHHWYGDEAIRKIGQITAKANKVGITAHFHAMGDQAVSDALTAIEYAANDVGIDCIRENRNAIAHLGLVKESDYKRLLNLNVVAVFNPWSCINLREKDFMVSLLGTERFNKLYPMKSLVDTGIKYSFGTDFLGETTTYKSIECFHVLTTRKDINDNPDSLLNESEKLSRIEALRAMTIGGAYQLKKEDCFGSIEVGKEASLCLFSKNLLTIPDEEIMSTVVLNSMYLGKWHKDISN